MDLSRLRRKYYSDKAGEDSKPLPTPASKYIPPVSVTNQTWKQPGHGLLYCVHGKSYFEPCAATTCRRTKKDADRRLQAFIQSVDKPVQK